MRPYQEGDRNHYPDWVRLDEGHVIANTDDPASPKISFDVLSGLGGKPEQALSRSLEMNGYGNTRTSWTPLEQVEIVPQRVGGDMYLRAGTARIGGRESTVFAVLNQFSGQTDIQIWLYSAPDDVYRDWGGVMSMLELNGILNQAAIPQGEHARIASAGVAKQVEFYEQAYTLRIQSIINGIMMTQAQTTLMMGELNYDLLFGEDFTGMIAD
ncbi:MAG: hypothetical protein AAFX86_07375 [Pseudomonadota bacterium]